MYIFEQENIRKKIEDVLGNEDFSSEELKNIILEFIQSFEDKSLFADIIEALSKSEDIRTLATEFAQNSDNELYCNNRIFVVIRNIGGKGNDIVQGYESLNVAIQDVDDIYIGCCDDIFFAENVWFHLLCALKANEADYLVNYCSVFEYDADGLEEIRDYWNLEED